MTASHGFGSGRTQRFPRLVVTQLFLLHANGDKSFLASKSCPKVIEAMSISGNVTARLRWGSAKTNCTGKLSRACRIWDIFIFSNTIASSRRQYLQGSPRLFFPSGDAVDECPAMGRRFHPMPSP